MMRFYSYWWIDEITVYITGDNSGAGRSPNAMLFPAKQRICPSAHRIFVWRQSLRVGVRADGTVLYGKSEPLRGARVGTNRRRDLATQKGRWRETPPQAARQMGLLHQANAPQRPRRVRGRAVRRHPQDRLRVAAPRSRHGIRLPGPDPAVRHRLG